MFTPYEQEYLKVSQKEESEEEFELAMVAVIVVIAAAEATAIAVSLVLVAKGPVEAIELAKVARQVFVTFAVHWVVN